MSQRQQDSNVSSTIVTPICQVFWSMGYAVRSIGRMAVFFNLAIGVAKTFSLSQTYENSSLFSLPIPISFNMPHRGAERPPAHFRIPHFADDRRGPYAARRRWRRGARLRADGSEEHTS